MTSVSNSSSNTAPDVDTFAQRAQKIAGKYMAFKLAREEYGLEILHVREIIGLMDITHVPRTKDFVRGVINLRGKVFPVVDLRMLFAMERIANTDQTVIIIVQWSIGATSTTMGLLVDEVLEVMNVAPDQIEPPPKLCMGDSDGNFILGVGKADKRVIYLLDIQQVFATNENKGQLSSGTTDSVASASTSSNEKGE